MNDFNTDEKRLIDALVSLDQGKEQFVTSVGGIIRDAIDFVLDGEQTLDELEACEKTFIGTKVEKRFLKRFNLPSKRKNDKATKLDTVIDGFDVDLKFTLHKNWMIPPEAVGHWCLLIQVDDRGNTFSLGVLRMDEDRLTNGGNRDGKRSVNKIGKQKIIWLAQHETLGLGL